jgi:DNA-binding MarR family transcriptional regulator
LLYGAPVDTDGRVLRTWRNLVLADDAVRGLLNRRLAAEAGCSLLEHDLLAWLAAAEDCRLRMLDLAARLGVTPGGLTRIVDRLERRDWLTRDRPPENRREVQASLTAAGRAALERAGDVYLRVLRETLGARLDAEDLDALGRIAAKLLAGAGRP